VPGKSVTVAVPGLRLPLDVYAYDGDSAWLGWNLINGRWYHGPGEVDVSSYFLASTGLKVDDRLTLKVNGKPVTARIAGEVFTPTPPPTLFTSWQTLGRAAASLTVNSYDVDLKPGTSTGGYIAAFGRTLGASYIVDLVLLALAGLAIPATAALGPATWAAASKTTTTLHAE